MLLGPQIHYMPSKSHVIVQCYLIDWMSGCPYLLEDLNLPLLSLPRFPFFLSSLRSPTTPPAPSPLNVKNRQISVKSSPLSKRFRTVSEQRTRTASRSEKLHWGTRVKDFAKNGASKRAKRGWFHFSVLVLFLARPKVQNRKSRILGLSLLRHQTETLTTQPM